MASQNIFFVDSFNLLNPRTYILMKFNDINDLKRYLSLLEKQRHHTQDYIFGIELEGALVDKYGKPLDVKDLIPELNKMYQYFQFDREAGACQLEIRTYPREYSEGVLKEIETYLLDAILDIVELAERKYDVDAVFLLLGANPHPEVLSDKWISDTERARKMAEWRRQFDEIKVGKRYIKPHHIALAIQSMHVHIQGKSPDDVADKFNRLLYIIPEQIAISANSPIIGGEHLDYSEARLMLYEIADGCRAGMPKIPKYPISLMEYGEYVSSFEPIMATSLTDMIKERHEDNRIRLEIPFRVENRVYPTQCTVRENMALLEYIMGRLKYAQRWSRQDFPPLKEIEMNRMEAIRNSLNGKFIWNGRGIEIKTHMMEAINKAGKGIKSLDAEAKYLDILRRRVRKRKTAADVIKRWYAKGDDTEERIANLVEKVWEKTRKNQPLI